MQQNALWWYLCPSLCTGDPFDAGDKLAIIVILFMLIYVARAHYTILLHF